eukprot:999398-Rhodomonas_salina.1
MSGCYSIRTAIGESVPSARIVMDIINPQVKKPQLSSLASAARSAISMFTPQATNQQCIKINCTGNDNFVALMGTLQVIAMQQSYAFRASVLAPEPKTQREARSQPDGQDWIDSEWIEMDTIY